MNKNKEVSKGCRESKTKKEYKDNGSANRQPGEYLEQVKCCGDTDCTPRMMKQAFLALKGGVWEEYKSIFRIQAEATEWAFDRI